MRNTFVLFAFCYAVSTTALGANAEFSGSFSQVQSSSPECASVFEVTDYHLKVFLMGPTNRTLVLNLENTAQNGFFHKQSLVGLLGPDNDFQVDKTIMVGQRKYDVLIHGLVNTEVLVASATVSAYATNPPGEDPICTVVAELSGMNR